MVVQGNSRSIYENSFGMSGKVGAKTLPKHAQVMIAIMNDMGINDFEPRVVNQLLEFSYRYISTMLEDAKIYAAHAGKNSVDLDDVRMAIQMHTDHNLTRPPPRDLLVEVAAKRNAIPLPLPKQCGGLSLPPERFCLTATNYRLKSGKNKPTLPLITRADQPAKSQGITVQNNIQKAYPFIPKYELNAAGKVVLSNTTSFATTNFSSKSSKPTFSISNNSAPPVAVIRINSQNVPASVAESKYRITPTPLQTAATIQLQPTLQTSDTPTFTMTVDPVLLNSAINKEDASEKKNLKRKRDSDESRDLKSED